MCVCVCVCVCALGSYLRVCQAGDVGLQVVDDALGGTRERGAAHQQGEQHEVGEGGGQVHHLGRCAVDRM